MNASGAGGAVPIVSVLDYLLPEINRPDLYYQRAYPVQSIGSGAAKSLAQRSLDNTNNIQSIQRQDASGKERSPLMSLYYTIGLIVLSAAVFLTLAAWSNVLLSWYDSIYVSPAVSSITKARLYFVITLTIISILVVTFLFLLWRYFTLHRGV